MRELRELVLTFTYCIKSYIYPTDSIDLAQPIIRSNTPFPTGSTIMGNCCGGQSALDDDSPAPARTQPSAPRSKPAPKRTGPGRTLGASLGGGNAEIDARNAAALAAEVYSFCQDHVNCPATCTRCRERRKAVESTCGR
jgi:hypothetical protein